MEKVSLAIVADSYWPSKGRAEQIIRAMVSQLPGEYSVTVLTHPHSGNKDESRLGRTVFMPAASPYYDPDGHEVVPLVPDVQGRLKMLPFTAWHLPLARRIAADSLYDSLYNYYKKGVQP